MDSAPARTAACGPKPGGKAPVVTITAGAKIGTFSGTLDGGGEADGVVDVLRGIGG